MFFSGNTIIFVGHCFSFWFLKFSLVYKGVFRLSVLARFVKSERAFIFEKKV